MNPQKAMSEDMREVLTASALDSSPSWALESRRGTVFAYLLPLLGEDNPVQCK